MHSDLPRQHRLFTDDENSPDEGLICSHWYSYLVQKSIDQKSEIGFKKVVHSILHLDKMASIFFCVKLALYQWKQNVSPTTSRIYQIFWAYLTKAVSNSFPSQFLLVFLLVTEADLVCVVNGALAQTDVREDLRTEAVQGMV